MKKNKLHNIIIGNGYIGKYLKSKLNIRFVYNSKNIKSILGNEFNYIYLAAPSSKKFLANKRNEKDLKNIENLIFILKSVKCNKIICISSIDVYNNRNSYENTKIVTKQLSHYGFNRLKLIRFIKKNFKKFLIIKLPSLFGLNEKKGFFYDLIYQKEIKFYNIKSKLQWYYTPLLTRDIKKLDKLNINEINLLSEPISCEYLNKALNFKKNFSNSARVVSYNIKSIHNFRNKKYSYAKNEIITYMKKSIKVKR